ncbi:MAG: hypothetical protein LIO43_00415 [Clostridiales bacterium]|nr:hypothetical protein [Clostridiales bacterium]
MNTYPDILRLRVLLCFLSSDKSAGTVTGISKTLGEQKYKITRVLSSLEDEKLVDKTNPRSPKLTDLGYIEAKKYEERINITLNHLMYEGVDMESAYHDALYWSLYSTEKSMQVIRSAEERYRVKYELRNKSRFSGSVLCKHIKDGAYQFPFVIYKNNTERSNLSGVNDCFENQCTLILKNAVGTIQLRALPLHNIKREKNTIRQIRDIWYLDGDRFIRAEKSANLFSSRQLYSIL